MFSRHTICLNTSSCRRSTKRGRGSWSRTGRSRKRCSKRLLSCSSRSQLCKHSGLDNCLWQCLSLHIFADISAYGTNSELQRFRWPWQFGMALPLSRLPEVGIATPHCRSAWQFRCNFAEFSPEVLAAQPMHGIAALQVAPSLRAGQCANFARDVCPRWHVFLCWALAICTALLALHLQIPQDRSLSRLCRTEGADQIRKQIKMK